MRTVYAVIDVTQDFDYVEGAKCSASFYTEGEARAYIDQKKTDEAEAWKRLRLKDRDIFVTSNLFVVEVRLPPRRLDT